MDEWQVTTYVPWLEGRARNDTSQFGEDGLIEAALARLGEKNRWCFEVGAADGLMFSNTKRLRDAGWCAVLIEGDPTSFDKCRKFETLRVQVVQERITPNSLDNILNGRGAPIRLDLGVIDIDGQDFWAFHDMTFRPRVMLVEFARVERPIIPPRGGHANEGQAGLLHIEALARVKGYVPLCATHVNLLMVREDVWNEIRT